MKRRKSPKRCPMRIAQLSVPTKRQCIDTWRTKATIICVPPNLIKSTEKLTEDDLLSDLSKDKSMEEQISNITEININDLVIDLYTNALEYAERQKETQEDYFLTEGITNIQQSVDLLSIGSESEYVLEDFRGELNKLIDQIVDSLMIGDDQIEEEKYVDSEEDAMEKISEHKENTNNLLQASQDSVLQEHNASINEEINLTEQTETFNVDLEHKGDDTIINDLTNETIENNKIVKEIIDDLLKTGVWSSEPNVLVDDYTKPNDTEVVQQELLENETQLNNEPENIRNEAPVKDNESKQEGQDLTQINDDETVAISLSPKISERQQIVQDLLITIFENFDLESALDENEDNKKVKFSAIDMGNKV
ncbi:hypothetical protein RR46_00202 [Papilio xuthus]|uniref:Uncharacterized protein n=1 Tax=Papilio xuthus TaxID=66420 RepID=A0A0N0PAR1_PAPXU|nr:hypothetical protein RR46_00202 [Papilio xuthus]